MLRIIKNIVSMGDICVAILRSDNGDEEDAIGQYLYSEDKGSSWAIKTFPFYSFNWEIAVCPTVFVVGGINSSTNTLKFYKSEDGKTWTDTGFTTLSSETSFSMSGDGAGINIFTTNGNIYCAEDGTNFSFFSSSMIPSWTGAFTATYAPSTNKRDGAVSYYGDAAANIFKLVVNYANSSAELSQVGSCADYTTSAIGSIAIKDNDIYVGTDTWDTDSGRKAAQFLVGDIRDAYDFWSEPDIPSTISRAAKYHVLVTPDQIYVIADRWFKENSIVQNIACMSFDPDAFTLTLDETPELGPYIASAPLTHQLWAGLINNEPYIIATYDEDDGND